MLGKADILFEDAYLIAVNKPCGLMVEPDAHGHPNAVQEATGLLAYPPKIKSGLGVTYRLDRPVSGVLIFAKTPMALKSLNEQIAQKRIQKEYLALVEGVIEENNGEWKTPIMRSPDRKKAIPGTGKSAQSAVTKWKVVKRRENSTLLDIRLITGRFHQIRFHASNAGHPIVGDDLYGAKTAYGTNSIALHAHSYGFHHPKTNEKMVLTCPSPF